MNVFNLAAKITLDTKSYDKGVKKATESGKRLSFSLGNGLKKAASVGAKAAGIAVAAIGTLTTFAVKNFAEYEQLVGGVDTLFGKTSAKVQKYADEAYKTAGMSANKYMETVTGFSASLLQSLKGDTEKAADIANMALIDMSDNANKMGTSMESIRFAYQGFAKQNYTMLDNLKLGYGGTKTEMERLLKDATKLSGIKYKISNFSDVLQAIHVIQDEMGITGTTKDEAEKTISGSINALKSAFSNLMTGFGRKGVDIKSLTSNLTTSFKTVAKNIIKILPTIMESVSFAFNDLIREAIENLPQFIQTTLPNLLQAGLDLLNGVMTGITSNGKAIMDSALDVVTMFLRGLTNNLPTLVVGIMQLIPELIESILNHAPEIIMMIGEGLFKLAVELIKNLPKFLVDIVKAVVNAVKNIGKDGEENPLEGVGNIESADVEKAFGVTNSNATATENNYGNNTININVNATPNQNSREVAEEVAREFNRMSNRRAKVYG